MIARYLIRAGNTGKKTQEYWVHQEGIPEVKDTVSIEGKIYFVKSKFWMIGALRPSSKSSKDEGHRDLDLHVVVIYLEYLKDLT